MKLHEELNCRGYYGFGGGWLMAKRRNEGAPTGVSKARPLYCNTCPIRLECWQEHRARASAVFPDLMAEHDRIFAEGRPEAEAFAEWNELTAGSTPPPIAMNAGNIEDGMRVFHGERPKQRGRGTMPWPIRRQ